MFKKLFYNRKLRVDILTLFLILLVACSLIIISLSYFSHRKAIIEHSRGTITRVSALIHEKIFRIVDNLQKLVVMSSDFLTDFPLISNENHVLIEFLHSAVAAYPKLESLYLGDENGNFIEVVDFTINKQTHYLSDPEKALPKSVTFGLRIIERDKESIRENWYYKDKNFKTISSEELKTVTFDPRVRPWYVGAKKRRQLYWSEVYHFDPTGEPGITVAMPAIDEKGKFLGAIGADLPIGILSTFLTEQKIGKTGKAFILDVSGKVLLPLEKSLEAKIAQKAFERWRSEKYSHQEPLASSTQAACLKGDKNCELEIAQKQDDFLLNVDDVDYLVSIDHFEHQFEKEWLIVIIAPFNDFFGNIVESERESILVALATLLISGVLVVYFSKKISKPIVELANEINQIKQLNLDSEKQIRSNIREINLLSQSIVSMRVMLRSFGRYVPKEIVKQLLHRGEEIALGGEKKAVTVFFADIKDFTPITEAYSTEILMSILERYFDEMSKIILETHGTIDKYIGDSIMAFWGAPQEVVEHEKWACLSSLRCQKALDRFNQTLEQEGKPRLDTRIGLHTGEVIVGNIGTNARMNYTIMGDVVNTAARLQTVNKTFQTRIIISDELKQKIGDEFLARPLDIVVVKGKKEKIKIYELMDHKETATAAQLELCQLFTSGYEAYHQQRYPEAKALFLQILQKFPDDFPTTYYLNRLLEH